MALWLHTQSSWESDLDYPVLGRWGPLFYIYGVTTKVLSPVRGGSSNGTVRARLAASDDGHSLVRSSDTATAHPVRSGAQEQVALTKRRKLA